MFDRDCFIHGIEHRFTKLSRPGANGQARGSRGTVFATSHHVPPLDSFEQHQSIIVSPRFHLQNKRNSQIFRWVSSIVLCGNGHMMRVRNAARPQISAKIYHWREFGGNGGKQQSGSFRARVDALLYRRNAASLPVWPASCLFELSGTIGGASIGTPMSANGRSTKLACDLTDGQQIFIEPPSAQTTLAWQPSEKAALESAKPSRSSLKSASGMHSIAFDRNGQATIQRSITLG